MTTISQSKNYTTLLFLILSFFVPIVASYFLYYHHAHFNLKTTNKGVLVNPPVDIQNLWYKPSDIKKWQVVYVPNNDVCDTECEQVTYTLNQIKKALGKNSDRVVIKRVLPEVPFSREQIQPMAKENFSIQNKVYLVDPKGNLFMYYASTSDPMNILKDLNHILEVSHVG